VHKKIAILRIKCIVTLAGFVIHFFRTNFLFRLYVIRLCAMCITREKITTAYYVLYSFCWQMLTNSKVLRRSQIVRSIEKERNPSDFLLGLTVRVSFVSPTFNETVASNSMIKRTYLIFVEINNFPEHLTPLILLLFSVRSRRKE